MSKTANQMLLESETDVRTGRLFLYIFTFHLLALLLHFSAVFTFSVSIKTYSCGDVVQLTNIYFFSSVGLY